MAVLTSRIGPALLLAANLAISSTARATETAPGDRLRDEAGALRPRDWAALDRKLGAASLRLGGPLRVSIVRRLDRGSTAAETAERMLAAQGGAGDPRMNPILLLIAVRDHAAGIATGKGNAGIVPEVDAERITAELVGHGTWLPATLGRALGRAVDAMVESAEATARRRRPVSADDEDLPASEAPTATADNVVPRDTREARAEREPQRAEEGDLDGPNQRRPDDLTQETAGQAHLPGRGLSLSFSLLAIAAGAVILVGLALRRRQQNLVALRAVTPPPVAKPKLGPAEILGPHRDSPSKRGRRPRGR